MRARLALAQVAHLATTGPGGQPHLVPVCFALEGSIVYFAVDAKPKRTSNLKRLRNIEANPKVSVLVDHYEEDWSRLWWVRVDGTARLVTDQEESRHAIELLESRYSQYRRMPPDGPVVAISVDRLTGWTGS